MAEKRDTEVEAPPSGPLADAKTGPEDDLAEHEEGGDSLVIDEEETGSHENNASQPENDSMPCPNDLDDLDALDAVEEFLDDDDLRGESPDHPPRPLPPPLHLIPPPHLLSVLPSVIQTLQTPLPEDPSATSDQSGTSSVHSSANHSTASSANHSTTSSLTPAISRTLSADLIASLLQAASRAGPSLLPSFVEVSSDSEEEEEGGGGEEEGGGGGNNAERCRAYRKKRKRVLSECERELHEVTMRNERVRAKYDRLAYRVGTLKAYYIHKIHSDSYKCLKRKQAETSKPKEAPSENFIVNVDPQNMAEPCLD